MKEVRKRILWVDIAKALAILSVVLSHTMPIDWPLRTAIFSFHMPLFFILSGYTTKLATDWPKFRSRLKRNFKGLILPTVAVLMVFSFLHTLGQGNIFDYFKNLFQLSFGFLSIADPVDYSNSAAATWFLIALFIAKTVMDFVNVAFKTEKNGVIFVLLGLFGVFMGTLGIWLPFYLDLGLASILFVYTGMLWRKYQAKIDQFTPLIVVVAGIFWFANVARGVFIEMFIRRYVGLELSILTAFAGTFLVSEFSKVLAESMKKSNKIYKKAISVISTLGQNTLLLLFAHCLDEAAIMKIWDLRTGSPWTKESVFITCILRLLFDFVGFFALFYLKKFIKKLKKA
jgi:fucose 4-O-acetylase-like acetyltransferase